MKVLVLSTSHRTNSSTFRASKYLEHLLLQQGFDAQIIDFVGDDIPLIGKADLNPQNLSDFQKKLIDRWNEANIILIVTPEYNWGLNANVINLFHQLGNHTFKKLFDNKIFAIAGVSSGRGGRMPAIDLMVIISKLISFLNQYSFVSPKILELHEVPFNLNEKGEIITEALFEKNAKDFVEYLKNIALKWNF
jgi:chromate reductase